MHITRELRTSTEQSSSSRNQLSRVTELILAEGDRGRSDAEGLRHHSGPEKDSAKAKGGRIRLTKSHAEARRTDAVGWGS